MNIQWEENEIRKAYEKNGPPPETCPTCKGKLKTGAGMVGEKVLYCPTHGIVWEDWGGAVARVI